MKKWQYKMKDFKEIYENPEKIKLNEYEHNFLKKIDNLILNKNLKMSLVGMSIHKAIYIIEKENISLLELEKIIYSLTYYFLKDYIDIKKLYKLSKMNESELKKESEQNLGLLKKDYELIEKKELNVKEIFNDMKRFVEWVNLQK